MKVESFCHYYPHKDSDEVQILVWISGVKSKQALRKQLDRICCGNEDVELDISTWYRELCGHEHDCCGCWFTWKIDIVEVDRIYNTAIIKIFNSRNV